MMNTIPGLFLSVYGVHQFVVHTLYSKFSTACLNLTKVKRDGSSLVCL